MAQGPFEAQGILNLQRYLRALARADIGLPPAASSIPMVDEDGIFGPETTAAVAAFQAREGLPVTGVADAATWERLYAAYTAEVQRQSRPEPLELFPRSPVGYSLGPGDETLLVSIIQLLLRDILLDYGLREDEAVLPDGRYGPRTEAAVRDFQRVHRLPESGRVDRETWDRIAAAATT